MDSLKWPDREYDRVKQYRDTVIEVGKKFNVQVLDTWTIYLGPSLTKDQSLLNKYLSDGLHLSKEGNEVLYYNLYKLILDRWPEMNPESMKMIPPDWKDIDPSRMPQQLFE